MKEARSHASREAKYGEKMIEVKVRFWTDKISPDEGSVIPKSCWSSGVVRVKPNKTHGLHGGKAIPFNSLLDIGAVVEKTLIAHGIILHPSRKIRRYVSDKPAD